MQIEEVVQHIHTLPPLGEVADEVQKLYLSEDPNIDLKYVASVVEKDPAVVANLLKYVNSGAFGTAHAIYSVEQAVTLIGLRLLHSLIVQEVIATKLSVDLSCYNLTSTALQQVSFLQSRFTMQWLKQVSFPYARFLAPLALLMETGKIVVAMLLEQKNLTKQFQEGVYKSSNIIKYEYNFFGFSSYTVAAYLFEYWKFDPAYVKILRNLDRTHEELSKKLIFSKNILKIVRTIIRIDGSFQQQHVEKALQMVTRMGLEVELFEQTIALYNNSNENQQDISLKESE
jgi:HD-like signal output (HDOD) protein